MLPGSLVAFGPVAALATSVGAAKLPPPPEVRPVDPATWEDAELRASPLVENVQGDSSVGEPLSAPLAEEPKKKSRFGFRLEGGYSTISVEGEAFKGSSLMGMEVLRVRKRFETGFYVQRNSSPDGYEGPPLVNYGLVSRVRVGRHLAIGAYTDVVVPAIASALCGEAEDCSLLEDIFTETLPFTVGLSVEAPVDVGRVSLRPLLRTRHYFAPLPFAFPGTSQVMAFEAGLGIQF